MCNENEYWVKKSAATTYTSSCRTISENNFQSTNERGGEWRVGRESNRMFGLKDNDLNWIFGR